MKEKEKKEEKKEKTVKLKSKILPKVLKVIKIIILLVMIVASYILSDKVVDYLMTIDLIIIKRTLNIILITIIMAVYFKK
jgi:hypothetical protein